MTTPIHSHKAWTDKGGHVRLSPQQRRRPVGGALAPVAAVTSSHQGLPVGCLWLHACPVWGLAGKEWGSRLGEEMLGA